MVGPQAVDSTVDRTTPLPALSSRLVSTAGYLTKTWAPWFKFLFQTVRDTHVRVGTAEAAITTETIARVNADGALASQITTVSATAAANTVAIASEATARAAADGTLGAQWGVTINANGRIVGAQTLSLSNSTSTFAVLADKFTIVHPSSNGTTITAFVTGLVGGVPTVGINGNLLVDGTILARSLSVGTLSAISANIGTVTAGVIQSASGNMVINLNAGTIVITS